MGIEQNQFIFEYVAKQGNVLTVINSIRQANERMGVELIQKFGSVSEVIGTNLQKIKNVQIIDKNGVESSVKVITDLGTVLKTVNGNFIQFNESTKASSTGAGANVAAIKDVTDKYNKLAIAAKNAAERANQLQNKQSPLIGQSSQLATNFTNVSNVNQKFSKLLSETGQVTKIVGGGMVSLGKNTQTFSYNAETANGKMVVLKETISKTPAGVQNVSRSMRDATASSETFGQSFERLIKRAALTIPVWFVLRQGIMSVVGSLKDGIKGLIDFDLALQKVKRNLSGTPKELEDNFSTMRTEITKTSIATGKSTEDIADAIKKFATIGFSFKDSMAGGLEATKLSILLFGEAGETAESFARSLKLLMDTSAGAKNAQTQFAETMSLVSELEKTNQFELNEVNESLIRFAPAAKAAGFSARQTLSVLAALGTAGLTGARGGTLLSSSVNKLKQNLNLLSKELGIQVNPQLDTTFTVLTKVLDAIEKVQGTDKMGVGATNAIAEIFGGEKGSKTITALVGVNKQLKENLKIVPDLNRTMKDMNSVLNSTSGQANITKNAFKEFKKALIEGIAEGDNFKNITTSIASGMQLLAKNGSKIGKSLKDNLINITTGLKPLLFVLDIDAEARELHSKIEQGLNKNLSKLELKDLIVELDEKKISKDIINQLLAVYRTMPDIIEPLNVKVKFTPEKQAERISEEDKYTINEAILKNRLEQLKQAGIQGSELLKQTGYLKNQLGIEDKLNDRLDRQLEIQREITAEKRLGSKLSSESMKLYDIAKTQGVEIAKQVGDVLSGNTDFSIFVRKGGAALDVFKKEFSDLYEQQQAIAFFSGNTVPGEQGLQGGTRIGIQENVNLKSKRFDPQAEIQRQRLINQEQAPLQKLNTLATSIQQTNTINNVINIASDVDPTKWKTKMLELFNMPDIKNKLAILITGQTNTKL